MKQSEKAVVTVLGVLAGLVIACVAFSGASLSDSDLHLTTRSKELTGFDQIKIQGDWQVNVVQGDQWQVSWSDSSDSENGSDSGNASDSSHHKTGVQVYVNGKTLKLKRKKKGHWWDEHNQTITAEIVMPELRKLDIAGGVQINMSGFEGEELDIDIAGAVQLNAEDGHYRELKLDSAGASDINLRGISIVDADLDIAGASDVLLTMDGGRLSGSLAGAGQILYYGEVSKEDIDVAGFGNVAKAD